MRAISPTPFVIYTSDRTSSLSRSHNYHSRRWDYSLLTAYLVASQEKHQQHITSYRNKEWLARTAVCVIHLCKFRRRRCRRLPLFGLRYSICGFRRAQSVDVDAAGIEVHRPGKKIASGNSVYCVYWILRSFLCVRARAMRFYSILMW